MWYGKDFNDGPEETEVEKRLHKLEENEYRRENNENFSMTGSWYGANHSEDEGE